MALRLEITIPPQIALDLDAKKIRAVLRSAGSEIAAVARRKVRQAAGSGRVYYGKGGRHRASLPGQPPASWTGQLAGSISTSVFRGGDGVFVWCRDLPTSVEPDPAEMAERYGAETTCQTGATG